MPRFQNNSRLLNAAKAQTNAESIKAAAQVPDYDTKNVDNHGAYKMDDKRKLISMLLTLKLEPQYYRSIDGQIREVQDLIEKIAANSEADAYWVAQTIVHCRAYGDMRSVNHFAAAVISPFIQGKTWARDFYSSFLSKKDHVGGVIYRPDDMTEIREVYKALHNNSVLSNAMKRGFSSVLTGLDTYQISKYPKAVIDTARLTHPRIDDMKSEVIPATRMTLAQINEKIKEGEVITVFLEDEVKSSDKDFMKKLTAFAKAQTNNVEGFKFEVSLGKTMKTIDALMQGYIIPAFTLSSAKSEAGQQVAAMVDSGKLTKAQAEEVKKEMEASNWKVMLSEGKMPIKQALMNLRSALKLNDDSIITDLAKLVSDKNRLIGGKIMPYEVDIAHAVIQEEFGTTSGYRILAPALNDGLENCVSNLKEQFSGPTLIGVDGSGSMTNGISFSDKSMKGHSSRTQSCLDKAALIGAMFAKATNADLMIWADRAQYLTYNASQSVFDIAEKVKNSGNGRLVGYGTNMADVFSLATRERRKYDRIIILSDNVVNGRPVPESYKNYIRTMGVNPYVYTVDLCAYGTDAVKGPMVRAIYGYGLQIFKTMIDSEINPDAIMDEIKKIRFTYDNSRIPEFTKK